MPFARATMALVFLASGAAAQPQPSDPAAAMAAARAIAPVFQVDMPTALERMAALPEAALNERQRQLRDCIVARFTRSVMPATEPLPAPAEAVLAAYRRYWTTSLMRTMAPEQAEAQLSADLAPFAGPDAKDLAAREAGAARAIEAKGLFVLGGQTLPLQEFMLWRRQSSALQKVALPGGDVEVRVTLLDDFVSLGWAAWGTCDAAHTGGWATPEGGIMVVAPSWDLASESYRVSLLSHESQHFSDYKRYPKLAAPDLEYRAKLVELMLAHDTQRTLLAKFSGEAARNRATPHPFASWWLIERLRARLGSDLMAPGLSADAVRRAAGAELAASDAALDARGAATVETALPD